MIVFDCFGARSQSEEQDGPGHLSVIQPSFSGTVMLLKEELDVCASLCPARLSDNRHVVI